MLLQERDPLAHQETPPARAPFVSLRLACALAVMAGLLVLAHGCHSDEDKELFHVVNQLRQ